MPAPTPYEDRQHDLNPNRDADEQRAADMAYSQLRQRSLNVTGDESPDALARALEAVERFEMAVSLLGGDNMTNAPDSAQPDDPRLVLPQLRDDEALPDYARRVREAAEELMRAAPRNVSPSAAGDAAMGGLDADARG